nr:hypothetical protein CFP56_21109 [Quercus suber]
MSYNVPSGLDASGPLGERYLDTSTWRLHRRWRTKSLAASVRGSGTRSGRVRLPYDSGGFLGASHNLMIVRAAVGSVQGWVCHGQAVC